MNDTRSRLLGGAAISTALLLGVALFVATAGTSPTLAHRVPTIVSDRPLALAAATKGAVPADRPGSARAGGAQGARIAMGGASAGAKGAPASASSPTGRGGASVARGSSGATPGRTLSRSSSSARAASSGGTVASSGTGRATATLDPRGSAHETVDHEVVRPTVREESDGDARLDKTAETKPAGDSDASKGN